LDERFRISPTPRPPENWRATWRVPCDGDRPLTVVNRLRRRPGPDPQALFNLLIDWQRGSGLDGDGDRVADIVRCAACVILAPHVERQMPVIDERHGAFAYEPFVKHSTSLGRAVGRLSVIAANTYGKGQA
jgi:hypothetical protein